MYFTFLCLLKYVPDVFFDSTGFPFSFFIVKWLCPKTKVAAYVHYPFISYDMINQISQKRYNNSGRIADSKALMCIK